MISIVLFGTGNLATHLFKALLKAEKFKVVQVYNHKPESLEFFKEKTNTTTNLAEVIPADIYLVALKDDIIPVLAKKMNYKNALVVHTSGATPMDIFSSFKRFGVFYPLQTFSKNKAVDFKNIPICIEANNEADLKILEQLAVEITTKVYQISSEQRKALHVAAVFVSNFVNYLYTEGQEICAKNGIPFEILHPLILETASKIIDLSPKEAQTGPAKRNDLSVINSHLELLNDEQQRIYKILTKSIQNLHGKEL
jgi:predicted short-subunit dehydrogenase-like oxidoreductase (DUF2520 family)